MDPITDKLLVKLNSENEELRRRMRSMTKQVEMFQKKIYELKKALGLFQFGLTDLFDELNRSEAFKALEEDDVEYWYIDTHGNSD